MRAFSRYHQYYIMFQHIFLFTKQYYHYTIYAIILMGIHCTDEPFTLSIYFHLQYIYQHDYFRSSVDYISYFPTLRGEHRVFVVTIQKCNCAILKLGLLRFDLSHRYLYKLLIFLSVKDAIQNYTW